ncbi:MAG: EF-P lysine aminoacylase GenX [Planctomycetaceae bacterium]|nr:EF-P lysine aminoacylase GenX [Planctomycetaceae bacterium]
MADNPRDNWEPTCSVEVLHLRSRMLTAARSFFSARDYLETETPLLSRDIVIDAHIDPFRVDDGSGEIRFLQTSPEAAMKRLLAAGCGSIFQVTHSFRRGEIGRRHNPEFTLLEWYGVNTTADDQMKLTTELVHCMVSAVSEGPTGLPGSELLLSPYHRRRYDDCFRRRFAVSPADLTDHDLRRLAAEHTTVADTGSDARDDILNLLLAECIEPTLGREHPEFVTNYPISQAALAKADPFDPLSALRFELYADGTELCNGYEELSDAEELRGRDAVRNHARTGLGQPALPGAPRLLAAMNAGLPACSGVALGFDRLVMVLLNSDNITDVLPFPYHQT